MSRYAVKCQNIQLQTFWTLSIVLYFFYLKQCFGGWILSPSSGKIPTQLGPSRELIPISREYVALHNCIPVQCGLSEIWIRTQYFLTGPHNAQGTHAESRNTKCMFIHLFNIGFKMIQIVSHWMGGRQQNYESRKWWWKKVCFKVWSYELHGKIKENHKKKIPLSIVSPQAKNWTLEPTKNEGMLPTKLNCWKEVLTVMTMKCTIFWDVTLCSSVKFSYISEEYICSSMMKMEAVHFSEISVNFQHTWHYIPEDSNLRLNKIFDVLHSHSSWGEECTVTC
jgi:hypothetical protein